MHSAVHLPETTAEVDELDAESSTPRAAVFYSKGEALGGAARDDLMLVGALQRVGLAAESVNLAHLSITADNKLELADPTTGVAREWDPPHAALMYHGALAPQNTSTILHHLERSGCIVLNGHGAWRTMTDKWRFFELMTAAGIATIPTVRVDSPADAQDAAEQFGYPLVCKTRIGTEGGDVFVFESAEQLASHVAGRPASAFGGMIAQPFVESRITEDLEPALLNRVGADAVGMRTDIRIMSVKMPDASPRVVSAFQRVASHSDHVVNNVALGAREVNITFADLHPADQELIWRAIAAMPDADIVGWDLIGEPGSRVIMEANSGPGLPLVMDDAAEELLLGPCAELMLASALRSTRQTGNRLE